MQPIFDIDIPPAKVLIVGDDRDSRRLMEGLLVQAGHELVTASSGEQTLDMVRRHSPDLVLIDVTTTGVDGRDLVRRLKINSSARGIPVILIAGLDDHATIGRGLDAGADDFLTKPVNEAELMARVGNQLRLKAQADFAHEANEMLTAVVDARATALVASERLYREAFETSPVATIHSTLDGRILRVNRRVSDLLGGAPDELMEVAIPRLLQGETPDEIVGLRQLAGGVIDHVIDERRYRRGDGRFVWLRVDRSVQRDTAGRPMHFVSVIEDITAARILDAQGATGDEDGSDGVIGIGRRSRQQQQQQPQAPRQPQHAAQREQWTERAGERRRRSGE